MGTLKKSFDRTIMDAISDMVFVLKVIGEEFIYDFINYSAKTSTVFDADFIGKTIFEANEPELAKVLYKHYKTAADNNVCVLYQDTYISKLGTVHYSDIRLIPLLDQSMNCIYVVTIVKNITKEVDIANDVEEGLQVIANHAKDLITLINMDGEITFASPSYKNVLGFNNKEFVGKPFLYNIYPNDQEKVNKVITQALNNGKHFSLNYRQFNHDNQLIWSEAHGSPVFNKNHHFKHMVIITRDISDQKVYEAKLEYFAQHDPLTELPNRRLFKKELISALKMFKTNNALIMLDIDDFKMINDTFGHGIGDDVIIEFGKRIKNVIKIENIVARLGGDEFIILLPNIKSIDDVSQICQDIQQSIRQPWNIKENQLEVTTSMGVTTPSNQATPLTLFRDVDKALYQAKKDGKNTFKFFGNK